MHPTHILLFSVLLFIWFQDATLQNLHLGHFPKKCHLPKAIGTCRMSVTRFYFNSNTLKCQKFIYGGCKGNANNFKTLDVCIAKCETVGKKRLEAEKRRAECAKKYYLCRGMWCNSWFCQWS